MPGFMQGQLVPTCDSHMRSACAFLHDQYQSTPTSHQSMRLPIRCSTSHILSCPPRPFHQTNSTLHYRRTTANITSPTKPSLAAAYTTTSSRGGPAMATAQPRWQPPPEPSESVRARLPQLSVYNSLTRSKTPFVPLDAEGRKVGWYACGPTVYDDSVCPVLDDMRCMGSGCWLNSSGLFRLAWGMGD